MSTPEPDDIDLDDPQTSALTTPELDGDDVQKVDDDRAPHEPASDSAPDPEA